MLLVSDLKKQFGGVKAVDGCTFEVPRGKITALIGPNGAGKSTLFQLVTGIHRPDSGTVRYKGEDVSGLSVGERARLGISRTFQSVRLFKNLTLKESLSLAVMQNDDSLKGLFIKKPSAHLLEKAIGEVGLDKPLKARGDELSYGQRKLFALSMALLFDHELLLLDEPVAGVNPVLRYRMTEILRRRVEKKKDTILLIEHDIEFVKKLADRVIVMDAGKVIAEGEPDKVFGDERVIEAYLGEQL